MVRRIRILVLLLVSGVSVAASGAGNSVPANDESHSSLPDLASESAKKEEQENKGKSFKEQGADYFINSATQGFDNLTPEALESQARSYLQNQITSSAQSYLEGVMSPYGKIRTSLSVGEGGDLDGSSLDYFVPWYDNEKTLLFSQLSAQRKEDRTISNFGLGVRQNVGNWLLGSNAFYDYDFTRGHRRLGLGTEAWTDYLKFSGNYYHPLSDWKDSEDFDFYEERPARGWDIRMESWLPFYPQLGAKLVYEQYYGDEVALFGTDNLQKDPHAVTLGLEYTPVPLVTVGSDYKAGTGDNNDFSVKATVNYQIGTPLAAQLDPENVKIQHSLMGSRTDFVDRNNFIILEYREKDPLDVTLWLKADATNEHPECVIEDTPEAAVGLEKCKWTVNALINHHYKIISASWQAKNNAARTLVMPVVKADALTEGNNNSWNLVLPAWVNADTEEQRTALNTWKVRMTLEDEKGNKQNSGVVEITVQQDRKIELIVDNIADTDRSDHTYQSATTWKLIALASGSEFPGSNTSVYTSCLASDNPVPAAITIEPVDPSQWYDGSGVHALKVKKGDTLQLKVTVKDASGKPVPEAPFVLTRGDGYDRKGEKYTAQDGSDLQNIVTPVVIDGESLAWTTTKMGSQTGPDGTRIISVTRPDTHGTRTAITATLYENAAVSASIDTIFTVVTSPDVSVARMWGHMTPSLTAADGAVYKRPLLYDELASKTGAAEYPEDNERWVVFYGPNTTKTVSPEACSKGYFPSIEQLDSLYSKYPNGAIKTAQGWPIIHSYWSGTNAGTITPGAPPYDYYTVDLNDDAHRKVPNISDSDRQYQICAATPQPLAGRITLTSTLATDSDIQAVKVKNSESIPLVITTTDAAGNPVPYTPFSLARDAGTARNTSYTFTGNTRMMLVPPTGSAQEFFYGGYTIYGATGADGTAVLTLTQAAGPGVKNVITAALTDTPTATSALPVVFTTVTSPDSPQANMYGHMPETFTASNGAEFKRPLLYSEVSSSSSVKSYVETNENWSMVNNFDTGNYGACSINQMATLEDLQALYRDHPSGKVTTDIGLPVRKKWWAGDSRLQGQTIYWQYIDLNTGIDNSMSGTPGNYYYQLCLTKPRQMNIALSTDAWNADKSAAVAKKGETIPMTVKVTNAAGQPVSNATVKITRGDALTRAGSVYITNNADDITLSNIQPSGTATYLLGSVDSYMYAQTDAQGQITFSVSQNNTMGLKTPIRATVANDISATSSKDVIFTVLTSPDAASANYWGHMPETVEGPDGLRYQRPHLQAEAPSGVNYITVNGEKWAAPTGVQTYAAGQSACDVEYMPLMNDLKALQQLYPDGALEDQFGWPVKTGKLWWSADLNGSKAHQAINLKTGQVSASTSTSLQPCLANARNVPATITLTSTAMDAEKGAAVAKKGEAIPFTVTVKNRAGVPIANEPFTLKRGDAQDRASITYAWSTTADDLTLQELTPSPTTKSMTASGNVFSGVTGADGTATFTVTQDGSVGLKTDLTASAPGDVTQSTNTVLGVIFTVITSPDSRYAQFWGHMQDTLTVDGVTLHRPLLTKEAPAGATDSRKENNETWVSIYTKADGLIYDMSKNCGGVAGFPAKGVLEKMRDGQITSW